jgi:hypothetical protein
MNKHKLDLHKDLLRLELSKADYFLHSITRAKGQVEPDSPLPHEDALSALLIAAFNIVFLQHLNDLDNSGMLKIAYNLAYEALRNRDFTDIPALEVTQIIEHALGDTIALLDQPFNIQWGMEQQEDITEVVTSMFEQGQQAILPSAETDSRGLRTIAQLSSMGLLYAVAATRPHIITPTMRRFTVDSLKQGLNAQQATALLTQNLRELVPLQSEVYYRNLASVCVNRARNYGRILAYDSAGVEYVEVVAVGDDRSCENCMILSGSTFLVSDLVGIINNVLEASTPEDVVNSTPFINGLDKTTNEFILGNNTRVSASGTSAELASAGLLPPFHPDCRCYTISWFA